MKKLFIIVIAFIGLFSNAQQKSFVVEHSVDVITKNEYYIATEKMIIANKEKNKGFSITPSFKFEDEKLKLESVIVKSFVGSSCVEKSKLYFLLENDKVITLNSWNSFNCDGTSYFDFTQEDLELLSQFKIKLVRFVNGFEYAEFQNNPDADQKDFFVRVITNNKIVEVK